MTNNHTLGRNRWLREFYSLLEEKTTMQPYKPLTSESFLWMPSGTKLKFGTQIIEFVRRTTLEYSTGGSEPVIEFIDAAGKLGRYEERLFVGIATEHLDAVRCANCNALRAPDDCVSRVMASWHSTRFVKFCEDKECAKKYFIMHPERQPSPGHRRVS